ncbi:MAG: hypothetical protein IJN54_14460 [Lachnospiraceae bacterium]|nr:hypothetical protein [Lachnospiraceae bacterium]
MNSLNTGKRVVLRTKNNLSFAGRMNENIHLKEKEYVHLTTCEESGFGVICPVEFVEEIIIVGLE